MNQALNKQTKFTLLILSAMGMMSGVAIVASLPFMSHHFEDIPNIEFLSKLLLTVPSVMVAIFAPFFGRLIDKVGRLKPLYMGVILFVISGSSGIYLDDFYYLLIGRAALGVSVALIMTSSMALIGDYFEEDERSKFISIQGMTVGLSGVFFIIFGGYLADIDWRLPFYIYLIPLLFLPLLFTSFNEVKKIDIEDSSKEIIHANLIPIYITGFFSMVIFYMLPTQLPYLIINDLGGRPSSVSYFIATAMLMNAFTAKQYHLLKKRFSFGEIFVIIFVAFGIGLFIVSQAQTYTQLFGAALFLGMGFGLILVNVNMWLLSKVHASKRGTAIGLLTSSFYFGQFLSPVLFQPIVNLVGISGLFFSVSIAVFILAVVILIFIRRKKT